MSTIGGSWGRPKIVNNGLVLYLDASAPNSYNKYYSPGSWRDLANSGATITSGGGISDGISLTGGKVVTFTNGTSIFNRQAATYSFWMKLPTPSTVNTMQVFYTGGGTGNMIYFSRNTNFPVNMYGFTFYYTTTTQSLNTQLSYRYTIGSWYNITLTHDTLGNTNLYINGILNTPVSIANFVQWNRNAANSPEIALGTDAGASIGSFGNFLHYSRALDASEVLANYNATCIKYERNTKPILLRSGLVLHMDMGSGYSYNSSIGITDLSGFANNGTTTYPAPTFSLEAGGNMLFNGSNQYAGFGNGSSLSITGSLTLDVWTKTTTTAIGTIIAKGSNTTTNYCMEVGTGGTGRVRFFGYTSGSIKGITTASTSNISTGEWKNIVGTFDGTLWSLYINGTLDRQVTDSTILSTTTSPVQVALRASGSSYYYSGSISQAKIYDKAYSSAEVLQNYNALKDRYGLQ